MGEFAEIKAVMQLLASHVQLFRYFLLDSRLLALCQKLLPSYLSTERLPTEFSALYWTAKNKGLLKVLK